MRIRTSEDMNINFDQAGQNAISLYRQGKVSLREAVKIWDNCKWPDLLRSSSFTINEQTLKEIVSYVCECKTTRAMLDTLLEHGVKGNIRYSTQKKSLDIIKNL